MHIAIVANGELPAATHAAIRSALQAHSIVIAADGGLDHCHTVGVQPDVLVGDLDSASPELVERFRRTDGHIVEYPADKNATDLELALAEASAHRPTQITVMCPFGGRLDHELATIGLLASPRWAASNVIALDGRRQMWVVHKELDLALRRGTTVSLLPAGGPATGVGFSGVHWPLVDATLSPGSTLGISNVATAEQQQVVVGSGTLLVITDTDSDDFALLAT